MTGWDDTVAGQVRRVMGGTRAGAGPPLRQRSEAEQRELRADFEARMDAADKQLGVTGGDTWRARREQAERVAAEARSRGTWISSLTDCPQCESQRHGHPAESADHQCRIEDFRLQARLSGMARLRDAELTGAIR